jgi:hypothetical protein
MASKPLVRKIARFRRIMYPILSILGFFDTSGNPAARERYLEKRLGGQILNLLVDGKTRRRH